MRWKRLQLITKEKLEIFKHWQKIPINDKDWWWSEFILILYHEEQIEERKQGNL